MTTDRLLGGRYELHEELGRGGMAVVHLGRDTWLERWVAVKVLRGELARDPELRSRFRREAQTLAALDHPGIVAVHDIGHEHVGGSWAHEQSVSFIVMEHVAGRSLRARIREGPLALEESIQHVVAVLRALGCSHAAGVVHRDIKPANVMVTHDGGIKVVDFGIARVDRDLGATATQPQTLLGSATYLSPEQVRGDIADARSDLYAVGCLLHELLTGRPPFVGDDAVALAYQHVHHDPPRASASRAEVTPGLDEVVLTALAKDRGDRFQSARSFREALEAAASQLRRPTTTTSPVCTAPRSGQLPVRPVRGARPVFSRSA